MNVNEWLESWLNLFPPDKYVPTSGYIRGKANKELINKMQKFCKEHSTITKDCIFAATKMYVGEYKLQGFSYLKRPIYFISKLGEGSLLDAYCDKIIAGETQQTTTEYKPQNDFL